MPLGWMTLLRVLVWIFTGQNSRSDWLVLQSADQQLQIADFAIYRRCESHADLQRQFVRFSTQGLDFSIECQQKSVVVVPGHGVRRQCVRPDAAYDAFQNAKIS